MAFLDDVMKAVRPLATRLNAMVKRAIIERVNDDEGTQLVQISMMADEVADACEHMQPHGLSFHPPPGAEAVALSVQGDPSHVIVLAASSRDNRPTGADEGEGGLHYLGEWKVFLKSDGSVHLGAQTGAAKMARADRVDAEIDRIWTLLTSWTVTPQDGGGALQTAANTESLNVQSTESDDVHGT